MSWGFILDFISQKRHQRDVWLIAKYSEKQPIYAIKLVYFLGIKVK